MKFDRFFIVLILLFLCGFILRFYQLSFFEYKNDQFLAIESGNNCRTSHFLVTHGMLSGVKIDNPPAFSYLMGVLTAFTNDPFLLTLFFFILNSVVLLLALILLFATLPNTYAVLSGILLVFSPAFTIYSNNIWAQCVFPFLMVGFYACVYRFIIRKEALYFFFASLFAGLAAQFHMSGFFLFLPLSLLGYSFRNVIKMKVLFGTIIALLVLYLPYLYHLSFEKEFFKFIGYGLLAKREFPWKVSREHLRMSSFDFFRYYFRYDFNAVLLKAAGKLWFVLYSFSTIFMVSFFFGIVEYVRACIRKKSFLFLAPDDIKRYPLLYQIAGFLIVTVTICYFVFRVRTPMHYFILFFPAYALITGYYFFKFWHAMWVRALFFCSSIATIVLLILTLQYLERAGGHYYEYGIHYRELLKWRNEFAQSVPRGECPELSIEFIGKGKADMETMRSIMQGIGSCGAHEKRIPMLLKIWWDDKAMRYEHSFARRES